MVTTKLNDGTEVLAKVREDGKPSALQYMARAQAQRKADQVGNGATVYQPRMGRVCYVAVRT